MGTLQRTRTSPRILLSASWVFVFALTAAGRPLAAVKPETSGLREKEFRHPDLNIESSYKTSEELPAQAGFQATGDLTGLGVSTDRARLDVRGGRWSVLTFAVPLLPGRGVGNNLSEQGMSLETPADVAAFRANAGRVFRSFVQGNSRPLRIDIGETAAERVTVHREGSVVQVHVPRVHRGVRVRDSYLIGVINHGNLVLFGSNKWGDIDVSANPGVSEAAAAAVVVAHVAPFTIIGAWGGSELVLVPLARGQDPDGISIGRGYTYRLARILRPSVEGDPGHWEALVDAHSGELISFEDTNHYGSTREVVGGVYPVSNDGTPPDGVEKVDWPMPFANIVHAGNTLSTNSGGNLLQCLDGNITSTLSGPFVNINDSCGPISLSSSGDLDFGTSGGTDCTTPGFGGGGNTHASRTGFHELNRIVEMGRGQLPNNTWLQQPLTANMNLSLTCNAFWGGGTVNFYRSGGGCANTGEIAGIFDHEWGHGLDDNDAAPFISGPSGEGIADIYTALRLNDSCIGRNFRPGVQCAGFGDPCIDCTGVRDIDFAMRNSGQPHDYSWSNANCGTSVHCIGAVYAEAVWDLWKRDLAGPPYNLDDNTALEVVTRLTFLGGGNVGTWFSGGPPFGGCGASSGYLNYLAADDDNGNLNDGTPHMTAIFNAFNRHEIACATPVVVDSGCASTPTTAPSVTATALDREARLNWSAVPNAAGYQVFRTDGVFACAFGKVKIGETTGTELLDSGLQNGRDYSYVVIPMGPADSCFGPASACTTVMPVSIAHPQVDASSRVLTIHTGDGDNFIDNCESATMAFDVVNLGGGTATNVRIDAVRAISHPGILPSMNPVTPASLTDCATGSGSFNFTAEGLLFGDTVTFEVDVTSDEMAPTVKTQTLTIEGAEIDLQPVVNKTWDFETDLDGWTVLQGTFNQTTTDGGANGSAGYLASSGFLNNQCDQVRSPPMVLTPTSTLTVWNNFEIENFSSQWWDRANVALIISQSAVTTAQSGTRISVDPDSGRMYDASGPGATCITIDQNGWAGSANSWASSGWSASALDSAALAGRIVQLDVAYGTDPAVTGKGFWFDQVTAGDVQFLVADVQPCTTIATSTPTPVPTDTPTPTATPTA